MNWEPLKTRIQEHQLDSSTWESNQKDLLQLFSDCQRLNVDPFFASLASLSNLRAALPQLKQAVREVDPERLRQLFSLAATLTNVELRLALEIPGREPVQIHPVDTGYVVRLTQEQFDQVQRATRLQYVFSDSGD